MCMGIGTSIRAGCLSAIMLRFLYHHKITGHHRTTRFTTPHYGHLYYALFSISGPLFLTLLTRRLVGVIRMPSVS